MTLTADAHAEEFARDIDKGLSNTPKHLPSRYFYDERGDKLFQDIMALDEYYLTRSEYAIFEQHKERILSHFTQGEQSFQLIEFGAGDGFKTKVLLRHFLNEQADFSYLPIDISQNALDGMVAALSSEMPGLNVKAQQGEYFSALRAIPGDPGSRKAVLFLGSNIGNFMDNPGDHFLSQLSESLNPGDILLVGIDLKKEPSRILAAYNDAQGVTADFNLNLLDRINRELGGNFRREAFLHYPIYNPHSGICKSFLISREEQDVYIEALDKHYHFDAWEAIFMEVSRKYDLKSIEAMAARTGFAVAEHLFDPDKNFTDSIWIKQ